MYLTGPGFTVTPLRLPFVIVCLLVLIKYLVLTVSLSFCPTSPSLLHSSLPVQVVHKPLEESCNVPVPVPVRGRNFFPNHRIPRSPNTERYSVDLDVGVVGKGGQYRCATGDLSLEPGGGRKGGVQWTFPTRGPGSHTETLRNLSRGRRVSQSLKREERGTYGNRK